MRERVPELETRLASSWKSLRTRTWITRGCLCGLLVSGCPIWAEAAQEALPEPHLEIGAGVTRTPGWLGDENSVTQGTAWVNAEYTTRAFGRFQVNGGSLTTDPSLNWDPWVKGIASVGVMVGYHGNASLGEDRNPQLSRSSAGLDGGAQVVLSIGGVPIFVQARKSFVEDQGWILVAGSYLPINLNKNVTLAFIPSTRWLDKKQSQLCFSAPAGQDGSPAYTAKAGFQDIALEAVLDWQISHHFHFVNAVSQRWLMGSASQTPLSSTHSQQAFTSGFSYHF